MVLIPSSAPTKTSRHVSKGREASAPLFRVLFRIPPSMLLSSLILVIGVFHGNLGRSTNYLRGLCIMWGLPEVDYWHSSELGVLCLMESSLLSLVMVNRVALPKESKHEFYHLLSETAWMSLCPASHTTAARGNGVVSRWLSLENSVKL